MGIEGVVWQPIPDYVAYCLIAKQAGVAPWQLFDSCETQPDRRWWREAMAVTYEAQGMAEQRRMERMRHD
jgi:hypothetical protein